MVRNHSPVTAKLVTALHARRISVVKALRISIETGKCTNAGENPLDAAGLIEDAGVDALLLDSVTEGRPAGTGRTIDWGIARYIRKMVKLPLILAGGLQRRKRRRSHCNRPSLRCRCDQWRRKSCGKKRFRKDTGVYHRSNHSHTSQR